MDTVEKPLLEVRDLVTTFDTESGSLRAVDGVSFSMARGQSLGIVGESGCGKSVTALSIMRLLPRPAGSIRSGEIRFDGRDLSKLPAREMRHIRGRQISMVFQEPMTALNPVHRIGKQLGEVYRLHYPQMKPEEILSASLELLNKVGISDPAQRLNEFPHQLSGGMRQRVMIGMALACRPQLLIADEPTTALDVTIQAQILELVKSLQRETGMAVIFITHDLGVIAETCEAVVVMYAGAVVERAPIFELFRSPRHPYTKGLLVSMPRLEIPSKQRLQTIDGMVPDLQDLPVGCRFQNRCHFVVAACRERMPPEETVAGLHRVACYRWRELALGGKDHD